MSKSRQISTGLALATAWISFAVVYIAYQYVAPELIAAASEGGVALPGFLQLMLTLMGAYFHVLVVVASTAIVIASEMKGVDAERHHFVCGGVSFFNFLWATIPTTSMLLPLAVLANAIRG